MTFVEFKRRLPKGVHEKTSDRTAKVWFDVIHYVVEKGQTSRYDRDLQKRIAESVGKWISDSAIQKHLKNMTDVGLLHAHRVVCRYTELGRAMLPLFGTFFADHGPPAGAHMVYTLPGMVPSVEKDRRNAEPSAPPNGGPAASVDNSHASGGPPSVS